MLQLTRAPHPTVPVNPCKGGGQNAKISKKTCEINKSAKNNRGRTGGATRAEQGIAASYTAITPAVARISARCSEQPIHAGFDRARHPGLFKPSTRMSLAAALCAAELIP